MKKMLSLATLLALTTAGRATASDAPATQPAVSWSGELSLSVDPAGGLATVKATWMGVSAVHAQPVLLKQLKQKSGLVVASVEPGGPAELAGLKTDDLITKLDDQLLINPEQFRDLIRLHDVGQSVTMTLLREGQEMKITPKLVEREVAVVTDDGEAPTAVKTLRLFKLGGGSPPAGARMFMNNPQFFTPDGKGGMLQFNVSTMYTDHGKTFSTSSHDGKKQLVITDEAGKPLFSGPVDTAEDQAKIPVELQDGFKAMQKMESNVPTPESAGK